jgi:hypothetical protein
MKLARLLTLAASGVPACFGAYQYDFANLLNPYKCLAMARKWKLQRFQWVVYLIRNWRLADFAT